MKQLNVLLEWAVRELQNSPSAKVDAEILLAFSIEKDRSYLFTWPDRELDEGQAENFANLIEQRKSGVPVAYLIGARGFWSLNLRVNNSTLIPRPETELLVETALALNLAVARVLDLGTGTGAIALAIAKERPNWEVDGVDRITGAVALANQNAIDNHIENVSFWPSDWFACVSAQYDLIVANPPYIAADDEHLSQGDVRFEPQSALISEENGLADIRLIVQQAREFLAEKGQLWLEHGWQQAAAVRALFAEFGYHAIQTKQDLAGRDRITGACR